MRYERGKIKQLERNHPHFKGMLKIVWVRWLKKIYKTLKIGN